MRQPSWFRPLAVAADAWVMLVGMQAWAEPLDFSTHQQRRVVISTSRLTLISQASVTEVPVRSFKPSVVAVVLLAPLGVMQLLAVSVPAIARVVHSPSLLKTMSDLLVTMLLRY